MKSVIGSAKFQEARWNYLSHWVKQSNETFVVDLAKMPHLLMAGATDKENLWV
jgi:S-DNA-T family DNA segregation ATPase FtsK/SpoIIIE